MAAIHQLSVRLQLPSSETLHPLDPMTPAEYTVVAETVRHEKGLDDRAKFTSIIFIEPDKSAYNKWKAGDLDRDQIHREAEVIVLDRSNCTTYTGKVDITDQTVTEWVYREGEQANMTEEELLEVHDALIDDPQVVEALEKRGITDRSLVAIEVWAYPGNLIPEQYRGKRIGWTDVWTKDHPDSNIYGNPVSGLSFVIDLADMTLLEVQDNYTSARPEGAMGEYQPEYVPGLELRTDIKALDITQPDGPSFTVEGNLLKWQGWSLRVGFNAREGMTLNDITFTQPGQPERPIAHKFSFAEFVVPYRDASVDHIRRTAFDIGEWGLGFMTTSLKLGCDCLGEIRYLDGVIHDWNGDPVTIENAVCIHEEDDAILWKHVDPTSGAHVRRARRFVVSFHATVANYEYLVYWRFYQDGNIECEVRATGIMVTTRFAGNGEQPPSGTLVDIDTYAPYHQHFLTARLDLDIDGHDGNTVYAVEAYAPPIGPENPYGTELRTRATKLATEDDGKQDPDWSAQKAWKIVNENKTNHMGTNTSYKLIPEGAFPMIMDKQAPLLQRAGLIEHTLWVTPNERDERWPAGQLVNQSTDDQGLPAWTAANRSIDNTDLVLWYTFGIHHITRPEEWPIMAVDKTAFWLKPMGFFDRNPTLDVPPTPADSAGGHCHS